jgi:hypothetical protein
MGVIKNSLVAGANGPTRDTVLSSSDWKAASGLSTDTLGRMQAKAVVVPTFIVEVRDEISQTRWQLETPSTIGRLEYG